MIKKITLGLTVIFLLSFTLTNNFRELVQEKLSGYIDNYPEKVYVQTDKPYYTIGEDIWFNTYLVNGVNHKRTNKSKIVYVELINEKDSIVSKKQLYIFNTSAAGDFEIKKNWNPGNYMLRAYTNYMRNNEADYFFQKQIPIWDVTKTDSINDIIETIELTSPETQIELQEKPDIQFFPEGGYLIDGLASKVGIKIKDKLNRNITINGVIKDSDNKTISSFKTFQFGLGIVTLIPETNKTYYAAVTINGEEITYPLPKPLPNGYNLNIVNNGDHLVVKVATNNSLGLQNSYLLAHQRGALVFEKLETDANNSYIIKLNTNTLSDGVTHFTLFNSTGKPVCERLVYIDNPEDDAILSLTSDNETPTRRDHVNLNIDLKDKEGNALTGNLSMAITDIDAVGHSSKTENIKTYLLLNSDLRGQIENPGYFFEKENDPKRRYLLDLTMLTHGWRRFIWNELLYQNNEDSITFKPEIGLYISGRTTSKRKKGNISASTRITFMGGFPYQEKKRSDANGTFSYGPFVFMDTMPTILEARIKKFQKEETKNNRLVDIHLDKNYGPSPKVNRKSILKPNMDDQTKITNFIQQSKDIFKINEGFLEEARLLDEVVVTATLKSQKEKRNEELNEKAVYGYPSNRIDMQEYENMETFFILDLIGMLPGVNVVNDTISIRGAGTPSIYLNNIPVELTDISTMTGADVEFIDVLKGVDASYFPNSANGVIVIHQREGADFFAKNIKRKPGIIDFTSTGFYTAREFYAPDHMYGFEEASREDIRTTLHWEPKINLTSVDTSARVSFFTSDIRSNYAIKIEGITDSGIPVYHLSTFEVE
ncbi:TonB-dependent receptor [Seonamhaeicola maritimus]|uniref:TonB-dependent receptor plug domain-containing protein n=1 Tax=Seonamhaeicola maritimus TaxID=2591822 RepID=A0A5C7GED4_9FLAO|nr:TonB-dependent receptor plug domain-containing protein [Seonamhaeicola maritimus]TXG34741.1 TonB-dependent receptor plug domain-containing protein [Seonamhaeicola maritimus]